MESTPTMTLHWVNNGDNVPDIAQVVLDMLNNKGTIDGYYAMKKEYIAIIHASDENILVYEEHNDSGTSMVFHRLILGDVGWEYVCSYQSHVANTENKTDYVYPILLCENVVGMVVSTNRIGVDKAIGALRILDDSIILTDVNLCGCGIISGGID